MSELWSIWNQKTVLLSNRCNLDCLDCSFQSIKQLAFTADDLSDIKPTLWPETINISGAEPLYHPDLLSVLRKLKRYGKYVRVWTNGFAIMDLCDDLSPYIDELMLYCPTHHPESYRYITGHDQFSELIDLLDFLSEIKNMKVSLNVPIKPYTVSYLQDLYDRFYHYNFRYFMHYNSKDDYESESIAYIKRFQQVQNCILVETKHARQFSCLAYPYFIDKNIVSMKYSILEWVQVIQKKYGPQVIFKTLLG